MFRFIGKTHFSFFISTIIAREKNPYLSLQSEQLKQIIANKISIKCESIQQINAMIELGMVSHNKKMTKEMKSILQHCLQSLQKVQTSINQHNQQDLAQFQLGQLLTLLSYNSSLLNRKQTELLTQIYLNTYSHILNFRKQLQIYESCKGNDYLDLIFQFSQQKLQRIIDQKQINLSDYVSYLRVFYPKIDANDISDRLRQIGKNEKMCTLSEEQKLTLCFIIINKGIDQSIINFLGASPSLIIKADEDCKFTCIKLQIIKHNKQPIPDLSVIDLTRWDYSYLIWISQFSTDQPQFKQKLHKFVLNSTLPPNLQPSTIFTYALNAQITADKHKELCNWLCSQNRVTVDHEESLCKMLAQIHDHKWESYYEKFYRVVLKKSLGHFQWESQNIVYYYGHAQHIDDENMEYLRRYILNTYAALGTARREIPTSSYFYKILQAINVEKFYKNL